MTRDSFHNQLNALDKRVEAMGQLASTMLHEGLEAFLNDDKARAQAVIERADELAAFDEAIETSALGLLMLQAPVARDLRRIGAVLKVITYLNRVGRYGYDIARAVADLPRGAMEKLSLVSLRQMARNVERMTALVLEDFQTHDVPDTKAIMAIEDEVDAQRFAIWRETITYMMADSRTIEACSQVMMVARYLERVGDNLVKVTEKLHYAATGERILLK